MFERFIEERIHNTNNGQFEREVKMLAEYGQDISQTFGIDISQVMDPSFSNKSSRRTNKVFTSIKGVLGRGDNEEGNLSISDPRLLKSHKAGISDDKHPAPLHSLSLSSAAFRATANLPPLPPPKVSAIPPPMLIPKKPLPLPPSASSPVVARGGPPSTGGSSHEVSSTLSQSSASSDNLNSQQTAATMTKNVKPANSSRPLQPSSPPQNVRGSASNRSPSSSGLGARSNTISSMTSPFAKAAEVSSDLSATKPNSKRSALSVRQPLTNLGPDFAAAAKAAGPAPQLPSHPQPVVSLAGPAAIPAPSTPALGNLKIANPSFQGRALPKPSGPPPSPHSSSVDGFSEPEGANRKPMVAPHSSTRPTPLPPSQ